MPDSLSDYQVAQLLVLKMGFFARAKLFGFILGALMEMDSQTKADIQKAVDSCFEILDQVKGGMSI